MQKGRAGPAAHLPLYRAVRRVSWSGPTTARLQPARRPRRSERTGWAASPSNSSKGSSCLCACGDGSLCTYSRPRARANNSTCHTIQDECGNGENSFPSTHNAIGADNESHIRPRKAATSTATTTSATKYCAPGSRHVAGAFHPDATERRRDRSTQGWSIGGGPPAPPRHPYHTRPVVLLSTRPSRL